MTDNTDTRRFEKMALPHLDAAYNLARWLTHNDQDAQDVVQEAWLRALKYFGSFRGESARPWLLQIVRHTCFSWLQANRPADLVSLDDEEACDEIPAPAGDEPQAVALRLADREQINRAIRALPACYRDVLILREMEDLSYRQIAKIAGIPIGTVMSRLGRARGLLRRSLTAGTRPVLRSVAGSTHIGVK